MAVTKLTSQGAADLQETTDEFVSNMQSLLEQLTSIAQFEGEDEDGYFGLIQDMADLLEEMNTIAEQIYADESEDVFEESDFE